MSRVPSRIVGIDARMAGVEQTGIGKYIARLLERLPPLAPDLRFAVFLREPAFSRFAVLAPNVEKRRVSARWYSYGEQLALPWRLLGEPLDLLHVPHFNVPLLYPRKFLVTIHDLTPHLFPGPKMNSLWRRGMFQLVFRGALQRASRIIAVSRFTRDDLVSRFGTDAEKTSVIYEGVDERFGPERRDASRSFLRDRYGIERDFLLYVGVWREHKNLVGLLQAYRLLREKHRITQDLVLCGRENPHYPEVISTLRRLGLDREVKRPGFIPEEDLPHFYRAASLTVIPSFYEGFGLTGLESLACGTPVAASRAASLPEILGGAAAFFDPQDSGDMARVMFLLLTDQQLRSALEVHRLECLGRFSWRTMAEETLLVYRRCLAERS